MGHELTLVDNEKMLKKAKDYLEGLTPDEFKNAGELVAYVYYLHILSAEYLELVAEILADNKKH